MLNSAAASPEKPVSSNHIFYQRVIRGTSSVSYECGLRAGQVLTGCASTSPLPRSRWMVSIRRCGNDMRCSSDLIVWKFSAEISSRFDFASEIT